MKKIIFTLSLVSCSLALIAQQKTVEEFYELFEKQYAAMDENRHAGKYEEAEKAALAIFEAYDQLSAEDLKEVNNMRPYVSYNQACAYALSGEAEKALQTLSRSIDEGYTNYYGTAHDEDFASIRGNPEFQKQLERIKEYDYLTVLQSARGYGKDTPQPEFTYQQPDAEALRALREEFDLDRIAGNGDEVSQIKNLMSWVHNVVRHDGGSSNPSARNASAIIRVCREEDRGVNCRMMAIILNECYLAMGFPSRYMTCLPKSSTDPDCHVINSVWSETLGKWLWMDPTFETWVTDDAGSLLSIQEVRERAIQDLPLQINPAANWNNENHNTKEMYLDGYMFKNLYWLECPAWSTYDVETRSEGKTYSPYVRLCPSGFYGFGSIRNIYVTNDPDYFWQKPE